MALSICVAVSANWPEYGMIRPILTVPCWAPAVDAAAISAAAPAIPTIDLRMNILPISDGFARRSSVNGSRGGISGQFAGALGLRPTRAASAAHRQGGAVSGRATG